MLKQQLVLAVEDNDDLEMLVVARDFADVLVRKKVIREELNDKYEPHLAQMPINNQQLKQNLA